MNTTLAIPDLKSAEGVILPNTYRIGDTVAMLTLRSLIDRYAGAKCWALQHPNPYIDVLSSYYDASPAEKAWMPLDSYAPASTAVLDDTKHGSLWMWNNAFSRLGHRINFVPRKTRPYKVVFAPLTESDYSVERNMHPRFVEEACRMLSRLEDVCVLIDAPNAHDWKWLKRTNVTLISAPLAEAIEIIGNASLYIGGDTGLSHIAGCFPNVKQIALHDRENTERHVERQFDHAKEHRESILAICESVGIPVTDCEYRSFPNKEGISEILFDHGGMDGGTLTRLRHEADRLLFN